MSSSEKAFLKTVRNLRNRTTYYIDLTGRRVQTSMFRNTTRTSKSTSTKTTGYRYVGMVGGRPTYERVQYHYTNVYTTNVRYQVVARVYDYSPLILDINKDELVDTARNEWMPHAPNFYSEYALKFDISGDGVADHTEWTAPGQRDGLLCMPENGKVETALQLFGTAGGYKDGFEKLAIVCDTDNNGVVEGKELEGLYLWFDTNHNAKCDKGELKTLAECGVTKLSTKHKNFVGSYIDANGNDLAMWDWWPAAKEIRKYRE